MRKYSSCVINSNLIIAGHDPSGFVSSIAKCAGPESDITMPFNPFSCQKALS